MYVTVTSHLSAVNMYKINNEQLPNVYERFIVLVWLLIHVHTLVDLYTYHCDGTDTNAHTNVHARTTAHPCTCNTPNMYIYSNTHTHIQTCMCMHIQPPHTHTHHHVRTGWIISSLYCKPEGA